MKRKCYIAISLLVSITPAIYSMSGAAKRKSLSAQEGSIKEPALTIVNEMTPVDVSGRYRKKTDLLLKDEKIATVIYHVEGIDSIKKLIANHLPETGIKNFQAVLESIDIYDQQNAEKYNAYRVLLAHALADIINSYEEQKKIVPEMGKHAFIIQALVRPNMREFFQTLGFSEARFLSFTTHCVSQSLTPEKTKLLKDFCLTSKKLLTSADHELKPKLRCSKRI